MANIRTANKRHKRAQFNLHDRRKVAVAAPAEQGKRAKAAR